MDFLHGDIKKIYFKYLSAAFGSALITSIYSIVDMAMVGQYQGPSGTAALAVIAPIWNVIYSLGLLMGIGGSVIFSTLKGKSSGQCKEENEYFTAAAIGSVFLAAAAWAGIIFFDRQLLTFFGAEENLLPLARRYLIPIKFTLPFFLFNQMLAAFLRNDRDPELATAAVLFGGLFNVFGDYLFVFTFDMGIFGAGLATGIGSVFTFLIMLAHFFMKKNSLVLVRPSRLFHKLREIFITGFSTFFVDAAMGILTILFNRQIVRYLGSNALSVYGVIVNISTFVQCCAYSVGQAAQPIISINFGAELGGRIKKTLKYALGTVFVFSIFWTAVNLAAPGLLIRIFMNPTKEIMEIGPAIVRYYSISYLLLPLNIFSAYYFQALMKPKTAFIVSVSRGMVISGILIFLLPALNGPKLIWFAMPITELLVAAYAAVRMIQFTKQLPEKEKLAKNLSAS